MTPNMDISPNEFNIYHILGKRDVDDDILCDDIIAH
jgi:hypothetical protein